MSRLSSHCTATRDGAVRMQCVIDSFVATVEGKFGPITEIRKNGKVAKRIPWLAFCLEEADWQRVRLCADILADANKYHQIFSSHQIPTIHWVIPAVEALFISATLLTLPLSVLHLYYKLAYIKKKWGGTAKQQEAIAEGNPNTINWVEHAKTFVNDAMEKYWPCQLTPAQTTGGASTRHPHAPTGTGAPCASAPSTVLNDASSQDDSNDDFNCARMQHLRANPSGGWKSELQRYLDDPASNIKKTTDTLQWWASHVTVSLYPTLARMALDILPVPASSVSVKQLFLQAKELSTDCRLCLGPDVFEWLECLNYYWCPLIVDYARANSKNVEECELLDYIVMVAEDKMMREFDSLVIN
ncbi:hypothetical protein VTO73DRAFT_10642 [Trametes versicolor]